MKNIKTLKMANLCDFVNQDTSPNVNGPTIADDLPKKE